MTINLKTNLHIFVVCDENTKIANTFPDDVCGESTGGTSNLKQLNNIVGILRFEINYVLKLTTWSRH